MSSPFASASAQAAAERELELRVRRNQAGDLEQLALDVGRG
ncbi:hypothetical protein [Microbacterium laevaniformans]